MCHPVLVVAEFHTWSAYPEARGRRSDPLALDLEKYCNTNLSLLALQKISAVPRKFQESSFSFKETTALEASVV